MQACWQWGIARNSNLEMRPLWGPVAENVCETAAGYLNECQNESLNFTTSLRFSTCNGYQNYWPDLRELFILFLYWAFAQHDSWITGLTWENFLYKSSWALLIFLVIPYPLINLVKNLWDKDSVQLYVVSIVWSYLPLNLWPSFSYNMNQLPFFIGDD